MTLLCSHTPSNLSTQPCTPAGGAARLGLPGCGVRVAGVCSRLGSTRRGGQSGGVWRVRCAGGGLAQRGRVRGSAGGAAPCHPPPLCLPQLQARRLRLLCSSQMQQEAAEASHAAAAAGRRVTACRMQLSGMGSIPAGRCASSCPLPNLPHSPTSLTSQGVPPHCRPC
jgi:hypothetical protein